MDQNTSQTNAMILAPSPATTGVIQTVPLPVTATPWRGLQQEVRNILERPFPQDVIRNDVKRQTDGWEPIYVPAHEVIKRLNEAFASDWSFEILTEQFVPPMNPFQIVVKGRLSVNNRTTFKEQFGSAILLKRGEIFIDIGADFKTAATDALKKCATMFGIALELYDRDERGMQGMARKGADNNGAGTFPAQQANQNAPAQPFQVQAVFTLMAKLGVPDAVWQQALQLTHESQMTQGLVQSLLSGTHPYSADLMRQKGLMPGLTASSA